MKKPLLLVALFIFATTVILGQTSLQVPQARWWYFGSGAGVDFNPNPSADPNGMLQTYEGCSSISGPGGLLYFYTDGSIVYNTNHAVMTNGTGFMGGGSSTQSGQVIPYPGNSSKYYIFTQAQNIGTNGMRYSVVDMTLSGGLGSVTATKNIFLGNSFAEKIAGVKKPGGYWVCTLKLPGDTLFAYEVTASGVNPVPVKSNTGISLTTGNFYGCMKANPNGTMLAAVHQGIPGQIHLFDFDKNTGMVTGSTTLTTTTGGTSGNTPYGVEFSPNGQILYVQSWNVGDLKQFDLTAGTAAAISATEYMLGSNANSGGGSIQTGPDGKMYAARFGQTFISQVANPDVYGAGATYSANAIPLSTGDFSRWGLPLFLGAFFGANIEVEDNCYGDTTWFTADTTNVDSMSWNFGDPGSGTANVASGLQTVGHLYSDTGTFTVQLIIHNANLSDTVEEEVYIYPRQVADFGFDDTTLCEGLEFTLDVSQPYATYLWHDGSTDSAYSVSAPDSLVMVTVMGVCDTVSDTLHVNYFVPFELDIQDDTSFCTYDSLMITTGLISTSQNLYVHKWSNGSTENNITVTTPGTYSVTVTWEEVCAYSDTSTYTFYPEVKVDLGHDSSFCYEPQVTLSTASQANVVTYLWDDGSNGPTRPVTQTGQYEVTVYGVNGHCKANDSVTWELWFEPTVHFKEGDDTSFCHNDILKLEPIAQSVFPMQYLWNDNSNQTYLNVNHVGLYWLEVSDENCTTRDSIIVYQYPILEVELGKDIQTCDGKTVKLTPTTTLPINHLLWSTGEDSNTITVTKQGKYSVSVSNDLCSDIDDINVFYFEYPTPNLGPDTAICLGDSINFNVDAGFAEMQYLWSTASEVPTQSFAPEKKTTYWVRATNVVCSTTDSIEVSIQDVPNTFIGNDTLICEGDIHQLLVIDDERIKKITWSDESTKEYLNASDSGDYTVYVYDGKCTTPGHIHIGYKNSPTNENVKLDAPNEICLGEEFYFDVYDDRFTSYVWQDGTTSSRYTVSSDGIYYVKATHECGVVSDTLILERCECPVWLPTAFNPDGDELNDKFIPSSDCAFMEYKFSIYDRWGEQVFYSEDPTKSWDGVFLGQKSPEGAYSWKLTFKAKDQGELIERQLSGAVLLLR